MFTIAHHCTTARIAVYHSLPERPITSAAISAQESARFEPKTQNSRTLEPEPENPRTKEPELRTPNSERRTPNPTVIDSHCHLADKTFAGDLDAVVRRAQDAGLERALVILEGGNIEEAAQATQLDQLWPELRFAVGVHPHQAHQFAAEPERAAAVVREQIERTPLARAVGEIGLDYHYDFSPRGVQHAVFRAQVRLARERSLPVVIHTREADEDTIAILRAEGCGELRGVPHCFTGGPLRSHGGAALGLVTSLAGIIT